MELRHIHPLIAVHDRGDCHDSLECPKCRATTRAAIGQRIMDYARDHYDDGGWDVIYECWDASTVAHNVWFENRDMPETYEYALEQVSEIVSIYADRQADAENSAF